MLAGSSRACRADGKTSRRSHDRGRGRQALHLVSAFATDERLVLGEASVSKAPASKRPMALSAEARAMMGAKSRARMEAAFDERIVIGRYLAAIGAMTAAGADRR